MPLYFYYGFPLSVPDVTTTTPGLMSAADKVKLDSLFGGDGAINELLDDPGPNVYIYVRLTGNDVTGDGTTVLTAFRTIQRALEDVPAIMRNIRYTVDVSGMGLINIAGGLTLTQYCGDLGLVFVAPPPQPEAASLNVAGQLTLLAVPTVLDTITPAQIVSQTAVPGSGLISIVTTKVFTPGALVGKWILGSSADGAVIVSNTATTLLVSQNYPMTPAPDLYVCTASCEIRQSDPGNFNDAGLNVARCQAAIACNGLRFSNVSSGLSLNASVSRLYMNVDDLPQGYSWNTLGSTQQGTASVTMFAVALGGTVFGHSDMFSCAVFSASVNMFASGVFLSLFAVAFSACSGQIILGADILNIFSLHVIGSSGLNIALGQASVGLLSVTSITGNCVTVANKTDVQLFTAVGSTGNTGVGLRVEEGARVQAFNDVTLHGTLGDLQVGSRPTRAWSHYLSTPPIGYEYDTDGDGSLVDNGTVAQALIPRARVTAASSATTTLVVRPGGSDTNGAGTVAAPYRTIQRALADIPIELGNDRWIIDVSGMGTISIPGGLKIPTFRGNVGDVAGPGFSSVFPAAPYFSSSGLSQINIFAAPTLVLTIPFGTITSQVVDPVTGLLEIVTTTVLTPGALVGKLLTNGLIAANGALGVVHANTATTVSVCKNTPYTTSLSAYTPSTTIFNPSFSLPPLSISIVEKAAVSLNNVGVNVTLAGLAMASASSGIALYSSRGVTLLACAPSGMYLDSPDSIGPGSLDRCYFAGAGNIFVIAATRGIFVCVFNTTNVVVGSSALTKSNVTGFIFDTQNSAFKSCLNVHFRGRHELIDCLVSGGSGLLLGSFGSVVVDDDVSVDLINVKVEGSSGDGIAVGRGGHATLNHVGGAGNAGVGLAVVTGGRADVLSTVAGVTGLSITGALGDMVVSQRAVRSWVDYFAAFPVRNESDVLGDQSQIVGPTPFDAIVIPQLTIPGGLITAAMTGGSGTAAYVSGASTVSPTDNAAAATAGFFGFFEGHVGLMVTDGFISDAQFTTAGGSPANGAFVWLAAAADDAGTGAGKLTATIPGVGVIVQVGICLDNSTYAGLKTSKILIQRV